MKRGQHAADDGSFGRSASMAVGRATILIAVAVIIGLILLRDVETPGGGGGETTVDITIPPVDTSLPNGTVATTLPVRAPREIRVLVANATSTTGAASRVNDQLKARGYNALAPASANAAAKEATRASIVHYVAGYEREARAMAQLIAEIFGIPAPGVQPLPANPQVTNQPQGIHLLVLVGPDLANRPAA